MHRNADGGKANVKAGQHVPGQKPLRHDGLVLFTVYHNKQSSETGEDRNGFDGACVRGGEGGTVELDVPIIP